MLEEESSNNLHPTQPDSITVARKVTIGTCREACVRRVQVIVPGSRVDKERKTGVYMEDLSAWPALIDEADQKQKL